MLCFTQKSQYRKCILIHFLYLAFSETFYVVYMMLRPKPKL